MKSRLGRIIAYVLIISVIIIAIGIISFFTNGFTSDFSTFYVECNGQKITTNASGFVSTKDEPLTVKVHYAFTNDVSGYTVKVVPNVIAGKDFDFHLGEETYSFQAEKDLTAGFDISYEEDSFTIKPKGGITDILQAIYPEYVVEECTQYAYENMFTLVVYSYNGESNVTINFSVPERVTGIGIDKTEIIF